MTVRVAAQRIADILKEYTVNRENVINALDWLKLNNDLYRNGAIPEFNSNFLSPPSIEINCPDSLKDNQSDKTNVKKMMDGFEKYLLSV